MGEVLQKAVDGFISTNLVALLSGDNTQTVALTTTIDGAGDLCELPEGGSARIKTVHLDSEISIVLVDANAKHYSYRQTAVSVGRVQDSDGSTVAIVGLQDPTAPRQIKISLHRGPDNKIPG